MKKTLIHYLSICCTLCAISLPLLSCGGGGSEDPVTPDKPEPPQPSVTETFDVKTVDFSIAAKVTKVTLDVDASNPYTLESRASWITAPAGDLTAKTCDLTIAENTDFAARTGKVYVKMGSKVKIVTVAQAGKDVAIASDKTGMNSDAKQLVVAMNLGWNLGNALEAFNYGSTTPEKSETDWGNPVTTLAMIQAVKDAGFKAVRVPVRWYPHASSDMIVNDAWMARVKEVVDYCVNSGLYVILNTHHELWLENHALYADSADVHRKEDALWKQIAVAFRDYDEHLLFAGTNEVHLKDNWSAPTTENATVQNKFNQWFVDAVRATGGKNTYRTLVVQTYATNPWYGLSSLKLPTDPTPNRMCVEFHWYNPVNYCLNDEVKFWGKNYEKYGISKDGQESDTDALFNQMKKEYTDKGYPLILGEFGAVNHSFTDAERESGIQSRADYLKYIVSAAHKVGATPFLWDNGAVKAGTECHGYFDRNNGMKVYDEVAIKGLLEGAKTAYPF